MRTSITALLSLRTGRRPIVALWVIVALACAVGFFGCRSANMLTPVSFIPPPPTVDRYGLVEVVATVGWPRPANPFVDASLRGWFETSDGRRRWLVEGFCDSPDGRTFRIRFMPEVAGQFRYIVEYRQGSLQRHTTGVFQAVEAGRRGTVQVDTAHPFHFFWAGSGEHYFLNGTTAYWLMGWRNDTVIASSLARLARLKVNRVRVTIAGRTQLAYGEPALVGDNWTTLVTAWPATNPRDVYHPGFDFTRFDVEYWQKFDRALRVARDHDMIISLVLDMNDNPVHPNPRSEDERRFIRYAVARFGAFSNVTWDLGDDLTSYRDDAWARAMGTMLRSLDLERHLITTHPGIGQNVHQDRGADWFGFTSFQDWSRDQHTFMLAQRRRQPTFGRIIPLVNEEYGYEDHYPSWSPRPPAESADALRRTAWSIVMAGGYQTTGETAKRGTNVWPDSGGGWLNGRGDDKMTMLQGYAHMVDFFTSFEWWMTDPHDELVEDGMFCLAKSGDLYAVYLPRGGHARLDLTPGRYEASWFDPRTGAWTPIGTTDGGRWSSPRAPSDGDWALLVRRRLAKTS
jgi:hypothetical protein